MKRLLHSLLLIAFLLPITLVVADDYYPPSGQWQRATAETVGMDAEKLAEAVSLAQEKAVVEPTSMAQAIMDSFAPREPGFRILGPTQPREGSAGLIIRRGYIVAEWGDLERVDMTFNTVKSYLSTIMALVRL